MSIVSSPPFPLRRLPHLGIQPGWLISILLGGLFLNGFLSATAAQTTAPAEPSKAQAIEAIRRSTKFYRGLAVGGGYVYYYSVDLQRRLGEGVASPTQIWVQPPGTPTVGDAFLDAFDATGDPNLLVAAFEAGQALAYGQLESGGWTHSIDFDPGSDQAGRYRNGRGREKNNSSLDDDQTGSALRFLIRLDQALHQANPLISETVDVGLQALLDAQFPNGGFPQVYTGPVADCPIVKAQYPNYDWRTENRIKNYWELYTINDNVTGSVARTLITAHQAYGEERYLARLKRLGDFLVLAQMPEPQPGWAQQYDVQMRPAWARRFEPPALGSDETQETIETLMLISLYTGDLKYLQPIPAALAWLKRSVLDDQQLARYYELKSNRPLYMNRRGDNYFLTYSDENLPSHYGWKIRNKVDQLEKWYQLARDQRLDIDELHNAIRGRQTVTARRVEVLIQSLDDQGRWLDTYTGQALVGQPKFRANERFISSRTFAENISLLSRWIRPESKTSAAD